MPDPNGTVDQESISDVPINDQSNNPIEVTQTSTLHTVDNGGVGEDGFEVSVNLTTANVDDQVNVAIVLDQSGSSRNNSGTDFDGDGAPDSILVGELYAARALFDSYIDAGYDPSEVSISLITYDSTSEVRGTFTLDETNAFYAALDTIEAEGPQGATNYVAGLNSVDEAWTNEGVDPDDTNVVVFLSDGFPYPSSQDIAGAAQGLESSWNANIAGIGVGANSSLAALNVLDNSGGAIQALSGQDLLDEIVAPLTDAEFLRFEIIVEGVDANGDPQTQVIELAADDSRVITTQLGWSIDCLPLDPMFQAPQTISVTFNAFFAEDPGEPGSGEQMVTTEHGISLVICFTTGTMILTQDGEKPVETLRAGDKVITMDHGVQPVRWIGSSHVTGTRLAGHPELRPVLIRKDAFGENRPEQDMRVSRQHRILVDDWRAELLFGSPGGVLVPAFTLINDDTIRPDTPSDGVTYFHIAFDQHEVIYADGLKAESFQPAHRTLEALNPAQRQELLALFPHLEQEQGSETGTRLQPQNQTAHVLATFAANR